MRPLHLAAVLCLSLWMAGCGGPAPDPARLRAVASQAGLSVPGSARLLVENREERAAAEGHFLYILSADRRISLPGDSVNISSATAFRAIEAYVPRRQTGEAAEPEAQSAEWTNDQGTWRGIQARSDKGYFLYLEHFAKTNQK